MPFVSMPDCLHPYAVLDGEYLLGKEIGCGGFGKVKIATHVLTNEQLAIKIIDKKAIKEDLPRVATELKALTTLRHQNIAKLYQYIETETHYFIMLEYCSGGELFDYIVAKTCLPEPEARHFFRQIVSALAYVHEMGFAHRDLKPENLLLTDDLQLKLIDFGLCANPTSGLNNVLETCCGSPAYAAPELIKGQAYFGNEADVWSMGILLYALLCGSLPFEDENIQSLYSKITSGKYPEPAWLSNSAKSLLANMLQVEPKRRITVKALLTHQWVQGNYAQPVKWQSIYDKQVIDEDCVRELAIHHHTTVEEMHNRVNKWEYDYVTSTYFLCLSRKRRGQPLLLPPSRKPPPRYEPNTPASKMTSNILHSPTIHASLDEAINLSGLDASFGSAEINLMADLQLRARNDRSIQKDKSYARAIDDGVLIDLDKAITSSKSTSTNTMPPPMHLLQPPSTPAGGGRVGNKENRGGSVRASRHARGNIIEYSQSATKGAPRAQHHTPLRAQNNAKLSPSQTAWARATPLSKQLRGKSVDSHLDDGEDKLSTTPLRTPDRVGRPSTRTTPPHLQSPGTFKTPSSHRHIGRRVFQSVERAKEKVITMLTPRRQAMLNSGPAHISRTNTSVNVSSTSTNDATLVLNELIRAFERRGIKCDVDGWKIRGKARQLGRQLQFDLEVVFIEHLGVIGVRRKRLTGDAFLYKRVCEDILKLAEL